MDKSVNRNICGDEISECCHLPVYSAFPGRVLPMSYWRIPVVIFVALTSTRSIQAQLPDMQPLAAHMAQEINKSKQKSAIVVDFTGPGQKFTELGRTLADNLSAALAKSSNKFSVSGRTQITEGLASKGLAPSAHDDLDVFLWVAGDLKIQCLVSGEITLTGDTVRGGKGLARRFSEVDRHIQDHFVCYGRDAEPDGEERRVPHTTDRFRRPRVREEWLHFPHLCFLPASSVR
jgi:hypothetical protein